jgi:O-antigen/teichoic acid export membrane protein
MRFLDKIIDLSKKSFIRDTSILQLGSFVSFGISAFSSIIIARLLGSDNYGIYALVFSFASLVGIFMNVGVSYTVLTLLPAAYTKKDKLEITNILGYCFYITVAIFFTVGIVILILSPFVAQLMYQDSEIGRMSRYLVAMSTVNVVFFIVTFILQSVRKIKSLAVFENFNKLVYLIIPILLLFFGFGVQGIVWGYLISSVLIFIISLFYLEYLSFHDPLLPSALPLLKSWRQINFWRYFKFGFLIAVDKNLNNLYSILPVTLLGILAVSTSQVAYFKIAIGYLALPTLFLTSIARILTVQLPKSLIYGKRVFKDNFKESSLVSGFLFIILLVPFLLFATPLIKLLYGQEYLPAVKLVYICSAGYLLFGFTVGFSSFFRTLNKLRAFIVIDFLMILTGLLLFLIISNFLSPLRSIIILFVYFNIGVATVQGLLIIKYFKSLDN